MTRVRTLSLGVLVLLLVMTATAAGPKFWTTATAADFLAGRSEGVFVNLSGIVTAGPALTNRLTSGPAQVWSLAAADDGTLWAGTGGDGRLIRLRPGQAEEVAHDPAESNVFAIAVASDRVYAAGSPDGRVYAVESDGTVSTFFDPEEKYIWALALDDEGRVWVGAGNPAVIYRVDVDGSSEVIYRPAADHVVALVRVPDGRMLAGTESPGRLYRFDADRPFVLLDSGLTELRAITLGNNGEIFAAAIARGDSTPSAGEATSVAATTAAAASTPSSSTSTPPPTTAVARRSVVYRIETDGQWEALWETGDVVYDLAAASDGSVLAATGPAGRLYRISPNREVLLHTGVDARQITRFATPAGGAPGLSAFATSNPGRVVVIGEGLESPATYLSDVRDTNSVATWGRLRWESTGDVALYTRSGNTKEPDDSWSEWAGPHTDQGGIDVTSPAARFLQWKAELNQADDRPAPALTSVTVAYLPRNARPVVTEITVHPPGVVFQRPFTSDDRAIAGLDDATAEARRPPGDPGQPAASPTRRMFQKGLQTIAWNATDADTDGLVFSLQYRRDGEDAWHDLRSDLLATIYVWDTTAMADGRYVVRVAASDRFANGADRALVGLRVSDPVTIDNTPPVVTIEPAPVGGPVVVRVQDAQSPVQKVEFSIGGGPWQLVYPADGLADSPDERYEIVLADPADRGDLVVRATDLLQNVTSKAADGGVVGREHDSWPRVRSR